MVEQASTTIGLAILGGATHALVFGAKAYVDGEQIDFTKIGLTVTLGGLIGLLFSLGGYTPTETEWVIILAAYAGFVAEIEAATKLLIRGYTAESRAKFADAADEANAATGRLATENQGRLLGGVLSRTPEGIGPDAGDLNDHDDSHLSLGAGTDAPYPDEGAGFEPRDAEPGENGARLSKMFGWLHESPAERESAQTTSEDDESRVITDGP